MLYGSVESGLEVTEGRETSRGALVGCPGASDEGAQQQRVDKKESSCVRGPD